MTWWVELLHFNGKNGNVNVIIFSIFYLKSVLSEKINNFFWKRSYMNREELDKENL